MLESLCNKVAGLHAWNFIKKKLQHRCFPINTANFLGIPFSIEHLRWLLLSSPHKNCKFFPLLFLFCDWLIFEELPVWTTVSDKHTISFFNVFQFKPSHQYSQSFYVSYFWQLHPLGLELFQLYWDCHHFETKKTDKTTDKFLEFWYVKLIFIKHNI